MSDYPYAWRIPDAAVVLHVWEARGNDGSLWVAEGGVNGVGHDAIGPPIAKIVLSYCLLRNVITYNFTFEKPLHFVFSCLVSWLSAPRLPQASPSWSPSWCLSSSWVEVWAASSCQCYCFVLATWGRNLCRQEAFLDLKMKIFNYGKIVSEIFLSTSYT